MDENVMSQLDAELEHASHVIYALRPQAPVQPELYQDDKPF